MPTMTYANLGVTPLKPMFDWYIDSNSAPGGNGISRATAYLAIANVEIGAGDKIGLARGSLWREMLNLSPGDSARGYGTGSLPTLDCADLTSGWTLSAHVDAGGVVYQRTLARDASGVYRGQDVYRLWRGDTPITRLTSVAAVAASGVDAYWCTPNIGATTTAYLKLADAADPNAADIYANLRSAGVEAYTVDGARIEDVHVARPLGHYGGITAGRDANIRRVLVDDGGIHHVIAKSGLMEDVIAFGHDPQQPSSIPLTFYGNDTGGLAFEARRVMVIMPSGQSVWQALYAHDSVGNNHASGTINGLISIRSGATFLTSLQQDFNDIYAYDVSRVLSAGNSAVTGINVRRAWGAVVNPNQVVYIIGGSAPVLIEHCAFYTSGTSSNSHFPMLVTGVARLKNNIVHSKAATFFIFNAAAPVGSEHIDNIWILDRGGANEFCTIPSNVHSDYNVYIQANAGDFFWRETTGGSLYTSLATWRSASGKDANSVVLDLTQANDLFLNGVAGIANGDFRLNASCTLTFADGTPIISRAGPRQYLDWTTRQVVDGQPSQWLTPPVTRDECVTYASAPDAWDFYQTS